MKKTIQKIAQKVGFWEELKETPKQVKMFFIWTLLIVAVVIYILPSISGKLLQGNVINVKSKISGYGYGNDSWYGYSYTDLNVESCKIGQNNNYVVIECVKRPPNVYSQEMQEAFDFAYGIGMTTHSDINRENMYGNITKTEMKKILNAFQKEVMGRDSTIQWISDWDAAVMRADFWTLLSRILWGDKYNWWDPYYQKHLQALKDHWVFSKIDEPFSLEVKWYVYLILKRVAEKKIWLDWVCETPENILACSLHLTSCPQECRPTQCQTPEMVLACSLGLDSCPQECKYDWAVTNTGTNTTGNVCQTAENVLACSLKLSSCPSECRPAICKDPRNVLACDVRTADCPVECRYGWNINETNSYRTEWLNRDSPSGNGDYEMYKDFVPTPCKNGYTPTNVEFARVDGKANQKVHTSTAGGYCLNSENTEWCVNYKIKFYCETSNTKPTIVEQPKEIPTPLVEKPRVIEQPKVVETPTVVEKPRTIETAIIPETVSSSSTTTKKITTAKEEQTTAEWTILDIFKELLK